ncbi:kinase-associated lipoprotein B [Salipaludibacillus daqingensis]|uniref:kinase-associated lipoprotein B n=1 Tax=Salipaludibacillus daqingensis TaxID=3041001 RepID=UPI0024754149|nr:kinase-associated lipoprotein B [Salipaludibacillus daqingensis]
MQDELSIGQKVTGIYKTGKYVGELIDINANKGLGVLKVLGVLKHPLQGDLHHPNHTDVPLFHERKALSKFEKTNIPLSHLKAFHEEVPEYEKSLKQALKEQKLSLKEDESAWATKSLEAIASLEKDYFK